MSAGHGHSAGVREPIVVELLGLPGSGKSTVCAALLQSDPRIVMRPVLRGMRYAPVLAAELASASATLVRRRALRGRTREHLVTMAYLQGLPRVLLGGAFDSRIVVFDQGPLYFLARPAFRDERLAAWRARMLDSWRSHLDLVVWLESPEAILRERIEARDQQHRIKGRSTEIAYDYLRDTRAVYEDAVDAIAPEASGPPLLRIDTSCLSVDETVARVLERVDAGRGSSARDATVLARR